MAIIAPIPHQGRDRNTSGGDTLLLTGIHHDELSFGDRVAALIDPASVDVMRIPMGITQQRRAPGEQFYSSLQHREIYLQILQQIKRRYRLLIDLHCGFDERGRRADVFCHDPTFLKCLSGQVKQLTEKCDVRMVRIIAQHTPAVAADDGDIASAVAFTWIPSEIWRAHEPLYVGLEVYLSSNGEGFEEDWDFACELITRIRTCAPC